MSTPDDQTDPPRVDDFDRGVKNRRAVLGDAWVDQSLDRATAFNADYQSLITRYAWDAIWGRPGLDHTTRRLLVLAMTLGSARWEEFDLHCRAALRGGVPPELIKETLLQSAIYCGVPAANTAFKMTLAALRDEGMAPEPAPLSAAVRVGTHRTFSLPQLRIAVQGEGAGAPVVLSHALGMDLTMWDALAAELAPSRAVLRYDARGHGGSAVPTGPYTMDELVDDAARVIREWGCGPVVWIGLSMGGMVGQGLALRHPELLRGLVLANTTAQYPDEAQAAWADRIAIVEAQGLEEIADATMARWFSDGFRATRPEAAAHWRAVLLRTDPAGYVAACDAVANVDWLERLRAVRCATLVIAGELDVGTPVAMSQAIAERVPAAELVVLKGAAHLSAAEMPVPFGAAVAGFLAKIDRG